MSRENKLKVVILAGGSGSRLWALSRSEHPKQFLGLCGDQTMLQLTLGRLAGLAVDSVVTICNEEHRFLAAEQLSEINQSASIILEPVSRNTAPAISLAALIDSDDDPLLLVLPADHIIADNNAFTRSINKAIPLASQGKLVTFGVKPSEPHVGYGYIERGKKFEGGFTVNSFKEKPDLSTAKSYLEDGGYYWNSGIFLFKASVFLRELKNYRSDIFNVCIETVNNINRDNAFVRIDPNLFGQCPAESIDYAVMEKTADSVVIPMDAGWSDIGSWSSLWELSQKDNFDNALSGDVMSIETKRSLVMARDKFVATVGVDDLVIVSTKDALLVAGKDRVQDAQKIVSELQKRSRYECERHTEVYRPWGKYDCIDKGDRYQVKRITVKPGAKLSLQMHKHRAEHWVVVSGRAKVTNGDNTFFLSENESTYIPIGAVHSLENPGSCPLEIIEIQSGSYLGEDDIIRLEDRYGRV